MKMNYNMSSNKQRCMYTNFLAQFAFLLFCVMFFSSAFAICGMDEDEDGYYGNAEICPFKNAVEGTEVLTAKDQAFLNAVETTRVINRWYVHFFIGKPRVKVAEIENDAFGDFSGLAMGTDSITDNLLTATISAGYVWQQWALELELYGSKKLTFTMSPVYQGIPPAVAPAATPLAVEGDVQQVALFLNVQYIIPRLFSWYPKRLLVHLDAGAGGALKSTNINTMSLTGTPFQSGSDRTISAAGNLGVGARYQITPNILVDVAYRYFFLGKTDFGPAIGNAATSPNPSVQFRSQKYTVNGFFAGAAYQF